MLADVRQRPADRVRRSVAPPSGFVVFHPRYRAWLVRHGVASAAAALDPPGEVVCGHPDRHVARVEIGRRVAFLKREHAVGWRTRLKNWRAGFGWVSRAVREAVTLRRLEAAGLPGPQWLAYGEDAAGRAFLLVDELPGVDDLRAVLRDTGLSPSDRRVLAERAGRVVAELHEAGFGTPELAAKHVLVGRRPLTVTLIDWQSSPRPGKVSDADRVRQLANLTASLAADLAGPRDRLRFAWAYLRTVRLNRRSLPAGGCDRGQNRKPEGTPTPRFGAFLRDVIATAERIRNRSSVRDQRQVGGPPQRLVWLAGEEVCAVPDVAAVWPTPAVAAPFYAADRPRIREETVTLPDGRRAVLARFRTVAPVGRFLAAVRGKPWRSPGAKLARVLFHLERYGIDGPRLLAFGQRRTGPVSADSFVLYEPVPGTEPTEETPEILAKLRAAGCAIVPGEAAFAVAAGGRVAVVSPFVVRLTKRVTRR